MSRNWSTYVEGNALLEETIVDVACLDLEGLDLLAWTAARIASLRSLKWI